MRFHIAAALALAVLAAASASGQSEGEHFVKARGYLSSDSLPRGSTFKLAIVLDIREGVHINAAVPDAAWPAKLEFTAMPGISLGEPEYPREVRRAFEFTGGERIPVYEGRITVFVDGEVAGDAALGDRSIEATFAYQACDTAQCYPPERVTVVVPTSVVAAHEQAVGSHPEIFGSQAGAGGQQSRSVSGEDRIGSAFERSALFGLVIVFAMGLGLSLTPCVYPMIPITIGYFGMQAESRPRRLVFLAALYVLGIALTYSALGVAAALTGSLFGSVLQNQYVPVGIALILVALALSMFGLYELRVPSSIAAMSRGRRGAVGALLMGLVFGLVAAPCVGPVTIALLSLVAKVGSAVFGFLTFFMLALGLGVPLFVLATFSGSISRLPRAGTWMISVRKVFGLLLLGGAIYYVTPFVKSNISRSAANLVLPLFISCSGLYIGWFERTIGKQRLHRVARQLVGVALLLLGAWLAITPSQALPPMSFEPYSQAAIERATAQGKPVMIDFTADWCVYCEKLEHETFPDPDVKAQGRRFVRLRADHTEASAPDVRARERKYSLRGLPTIIFLDSSGREVQRARVVGFVRPNALVEKMRMVR